MYPLMEENFAVFVWPLERRPPKADEAVLAEARSRFDRSPYRELRAIACDFREGLLILRGRVPSFFIKQIAQSAVFSIERIEEIENRLEVVED